jgi:hypothetical protein
MQITEQHEQDAANLVERPVAVEAGSGVSAEAPAWAGYMAAVERIEWDSQGDAGWWADSSGDLCVYPGGACVDKAGAEFTPQQLRDEAFERLALADITEREQKKAADV